MADARGKSIEDKEEEMLLAAWEWRGKRGFQSGCDSACSKAPCVPPAPLPLCIAASS
jgi:hypothetical protein